MIKLEKVPTITLAAIAAILILEIAAIRAGINGATLGFAVAAIAGLGGYEIRKLRKR